MKADRITEFLVVMIFALAVGTGAILAILYLEETPRAVAIVLVLIAALGSWQYLRKRFGRA